MFYTKIPPLPARTYIGNKLFAKKWRKTSNTDLAMAGAVCPPYRGSPPYAIFQHSKNRKILALQCAITQLLVDAQLKSTHFSTSFTVFFIFFTSAPPAPYHPCACWTATRSQPLHTVALLNWSWFHPLLKISQLSNRFALLPPFFLPFLIRVGFDQNPS